MTRIEAKKITAMLAAYYDVPAWSEERMTIFAELLIDLDAASTQQAAMEWMRATPQRRPDAADIRRAVATAQGDGHLQPEEAWGFVMRCFSRIGQYRPFPPKYPLVKRVVDLLGWEVLCQSENQVADRARFLEAYSNQLAAATRASAASRGATPVAIPMTADDVTKLDSPAKRVGNLADLTARIGRAIS